MTPTPLPLLCISCRRALVLKNAGAFECQHCGEHYEAQPNRLKTAPDKHLFRMYRKKYLVNKALNNNGFISYSQLPEGSISLPDRSDVARFRSFIHSEVRAGIILDVGCGPLPLAGYLEFPDKGQYRFVGLDPIDVASYEGYRIIGASELMPIQDASVDAIVFGTSLDHVCDLNQTIREARRVVKRDGRILVWMSDSSQTLAGRARKWVKDAVTSLRLGYSVRRYRVYPNFTVLEIPRGAVDPFHRFFESPDLIVKKFERTSCRLVRREAFSKDEHFLCFAAA